uniref:Uncharacterized protein LOC104225346 n=1 Tax=Nicotiana sylvestris TaxID=4096 RepID=A0A1U7W5W8_NICSY|nr:PREDICTED: uncharacterized protein LOC104225346 [Nicotiana sylvestris]
MQELIAKLQVQPYKAYTWFNNQLRWKSKLVVGNDHQLRENIITVWHSTTQGGHSDVRDFINKYDVCQRHKYDVAASPSLLQPLPIPIGVWTDICLDFIEGLPKSHGKEVILRSTAYHPQTDGQSEVLNKTLEAYLRCFCSDSPKDWSKYLPLTEWWYNTTYYSTIKCTPYEALYGQKSPIHLPYLRGDTDVEMVDRSLEAKEAIIQLLKFHLARAQQRMKDTANQHRSERSFEVGDWVYLKLQPYRQILVASRPFNKLAAKYYGPYPIAAKIGLVAYKLLMPADVLIHLTFHVSQLKKCHEVPTIINYPHILHLSSPFCPQPESILERRLVKHGNKVVCQVRIKWTGLDADSATWEYLQELQTKFPSFNP